VSGIRYIKNSTVSLNLFFYSYISLSVLENNRSPHAISERERAKIRVKWGAGSHTAFWNVT
jgi:hypothetical protein